MAGTALSKQLEKKLINSAIKARDNAYCPYSNYPVGASVLAGSGRIYCGCNVENASFGLACCAERTAVFSAIAGGEKKIKAICIAAKSAKPCGACRQVLMEFLDAGSPILIIDITGKGKYKITRSRICQLLPMAFNPLEAGL